MADSTSSNSTTRPTLIGRSGPAGDGSAIIIPPFGLDRARPSHPYHSAARAVRTGSFTHGGHVRRAGCSPSGPFLIFSGTAVAVFVRARSVSDGPDINPSLTLRA